VPLALSSPPPHPAAIAASAKTESRATTPQRVRLLFNPYIGLLTFILLKAKLDGTSRLKAKR